MHCTNCGAALQPGMAACPTCGTPVASNPAQQPQPSYDPTIVASPYGTPQNAQAEYGANPYGALQSGGTHYAPYGNLPSAPSPYGSTGYNQPAPPPNYGYPQGQPQGGYVPGGVPGMPGSYGVFPTQPPKKRSRVGLIVGIVVGGVLLLCVGLAALGAVINSHTSKTTTSSSTSSTTSTNSTGAPSGKTIASSAAAILHNPQTSTDVDKDYNPTHVTSTFKANQEVYVTFDIDSGNKDGYIQAKWYADGQVISTRSFAHTHTHNVGLFSRVYDTATNDGVAELYWCTQSDCGDAQLAQVVHFTVNGTTLAPTGAGVALIQGAYRRVL